MAGALQLNHLVTDLIDLNNLDRSTSAILAENIANLKWKSFAYSALEKICYVALLAIIATVFAVSYNLIAMTGAMPFAVSGLILSTPLLVCAPIKFIQNAAYYSQQVENESEVYLKFREITEIEKWTSQQIEQFMNDKGIRPDSVPLNALRSINMTEPLKALLPIIARFKSLEAKVNQIREKAGASLPRLEEDFKKKEAQLGHPINAQEKQKNRFETKSTYEEIFENQAIPMALKAAVLLQILQDPTDIELDISTTLELPRVGICMPRFFGERQFGKTYGNDDYFIFHPDLHRAPISHQTIIENQMDPANLRRLLFPGAIRV